MDNKCKVPVCKRTKYAKEYCKTHYMQYLRKGDVANKAIQRPHTLLPDDIGDTAVCVECNQCLDKEKFLTVIRGRSCYKDKCRDCTAKYYSLRQRARKFNIPFEELVIKVQKANNICALCGDQVQILFLDHDHKCCDTNRYDVIYSCGQCNRDLICQGCNIGLGGFRDNKEKLKKAILYLEKFERS